MATDSIALAAAGDGRYGCRQVARAKRWPGDTNPSIASGANRAASIFGVVIGDLPVNWEVAESCRCPVIFDRPSAGQRGPGVPTVPIHQMKTAGLVDATSHRLDEAAVIQAPASPIPAAADCPRVLSAGVNSNSVSSKFRTARQ